MSMKIWNEIIWNQPVTAFALTGHDEAICANQDTLYHYKITTGIQTALLSLPGLIKDQAGITLKVSENGRFIAVYLSYGAHGLVYDRSTASVVLGLDRGNYHTEHSAFPIAFFEQDNRQYLVHATGWNVLHITDLESRERITERQQITYDEKTAENAAKYLDYFHSLLHISPH